MPETLFDEIKKLDLMAHITANCGATPLSPGSRTTHVNPCPLCGHNDCFTYYLETNSFKCFSCDRAGDIINFERERLGLESNLAAAKSLGDQYNIADPSVGAGHARDKGPDPIKTTPPMAAAAPTSGPLADDLPPIDRNRAITLRNLMTEYYHDCLMSDPGGLAYQTGTRGHRIDTMKAERVGMAKHGWRFAQITKKAGFTDADLHAVGLVRKSKTGKYLLVINDGIYVHPHRDAAGNTLHWSLKDPDKEKKWQPVKAAADPDWLTLGQPALDAPEFWLVEGENDRLTLLDHGIPHVCAIIGNTKVKEIRQYISSIAPGRTIYLAFDPNPAGEKYDKQFIDTITQAGGTCKTVMESLKTFGDDIDALIRKAGNPAGFLAEIMKNAREIAPSTATPGTASSPAPDWHFESFDVLGEMDNNDLAFWSMEERKAKTYTIPIKNLTLDQLIQIGGREVATRVVRTAAERIDDKIIFSALKKEIIMTANRTQLGKMKHLGQGIHLLDDKSLLLVNGKTSWIWTGAEFLHHPYPLIERKFMEFEEGAEWIDAAALEASLKSMTRERAGVILDLFLSQLQQWTFVGAMDLLTVAGFVLAQIVQAAWDWRPHLWLAGGAGSGKTKLLELLKSIFSKYIAIYEGKPTSEAGLRQVMTAYMKMTCIDEFENNQDRGKIIDLLRSCGRSGQAVKGSPTGKDPNEYRLRHMVMVCSIEVGLARAAERSRFLICSTKKELGHITPIAPTSATCARLHIDLTALALWGFREAMELIRNLGVDPDQDTRMAESIAVPYAMLAICTDNPTESLRENIRLYMAEWERLDAGGVLEDEISLLQDILMSNIRVSVTQEEMGTTNPKIINVERTVGQLLEEDPMPEDHNQALQAAGIKLEIDNSLFIAHDKARRALLRTTKWKDLNILDILRRIPGAQYKKLRMGGASPYGVSIPGTTWMEV